MDNNIFYKKTLSLLPKGIFWKGRDFLKLLYCSSFIFERINTDIKRILDECFPLNSVDCLDDWERFLEITPLTDNIDLRRQLIASKLASIGGNTHEYFLTIVRKYDPLCEISASLTSDKFIVGISRAGQRLGSIENTKSTAIFNFRIENRQKELEDLLNIIKPAHVSFIFIYKVSFNNKKNGD